MGDDIDFEAEMGAASTVYGLRAGHTLTQDDYEAIQLYNESSRRDQERAIDAFNRGYKQGIREGGSADIAELKANIDKRFIDLSVEKVMRTLSDQRVDELQAALTGLLPILATAESNASGNPEWEYVSARVNAARAAVANAIGENGRG